MDREVYLKKWEFRYWIGELPKLEVKNICESIIEIKNANKVLNDALQVALELSLHKDVSGYAMLGFDYVPTKNSKALTVKVSYYDENDISYLSHLRPNLSKYMHTGIDKSLSEAIINKIIDVSKESALPAGELNFKVASNCDVSSSPKIFGIITKILLNILVGMDREKLSDKNYLDELFTETITETILNSENFIMRR